MQKLLRYPATLAPAESHGGCLCAHIEHHLASGCFRNCQVHLSSTVNAEDRILTVTTALVRNQMCNKTEFCCYWPPNGPVLFCSLASVVCRWSASSVTSYVGVCESILVGCVAQWLERWSLTSELSCPTLDLQLTGDHLCGYAVRYRSAN